MKTKINKHRKSLEYFKIDVLNKIVRVAAVALEVTLYLAYTIILYYKQTMYIFPQRETYNDKIT